MFRVFYLTICGLLLAGIVHIAIILLIPSFGTKDAPAKISSAAPVFDFTVLEANQQSSISNLDPFFRIGACRYNLAEAPLIVDAPPTDAFWSAALFDEDGKVFYSLSDRTTIGGRLRLILVNSVQMAGLRELQPEDMDTAIVAVSERDEGFLVLRVLSPDDSWSKGTKDFMSSISCEKYELNVQ